MIQLDKKHRYGLSLLSGLLMTFSFPYTGSLTPLVFVSWIPLLLLEDYISRKKYRSGKIFLHAYIAFFVYNIGTTWWIWNASLNGAIGAFVLNALLMALAFFAYHLTKKHVGKKEGYLSLFFFWIAFEYLHYHWELSWPWLSLGNTFSIVPSWVQWYSYTGVLGGTFWILLLNILGFRIIQNVYFKRESWRIQTPLVWTFGFLILVPIGISLLSYFRYSEKKNPVEVVIVQPNIDPYNEKFTGPLEAQLAKITDLATSKVTARTKFVIAPETAISQGFYEEDVLQVYSTQYLIEQRNKWKTPHLFIGASTAKTFEKPNSFASRPMSGGPGYIEYYNTSMLLNNQNEVEFVHKSELVLGVEKLPFSSIFPFLEELSIENGGTTGTLGIETESKVLHTNELTFAPMICYESIYGEMLAEQCRKGAQALFVITNDGWWGNTPGYKQHMSFSRLRAIESRRSVARSANTGISCIINQRGDIIQQLGWWKAGAIRGNINKNDEITFYSTYGDVMGRSFTFVSALLLLFTFVKFFKKKYIR